MSKPSGEPSTSPPANLDRVHVNSVMGLSLRYPESWRIGERTGEIIHVAPAETAQFFVDVVMDTFRDFRTAERDATLESNDRKRTGASVRISSLTVAGHPGMRFSIIYAAKPTTPVPDWCSGCHVETVVVDWRPGVALQLTIQANDTAVFTRYGATANAIIESIQAA